MDLERLFPLVDQMLFDYLVYRFANRYAADKARSTTDSDPTLSLLNPLIEELLQTALQNKDTNRNKVYLLLLIFTVRVLEGISISEAESNSDKAQGEKDNEDDVATNEQISGDQALTVISHLTDMQKTLKVFSDTLEREAIKSLTRKCLVECLVMKYQFSVQVKSGEEEALEALHNLVGGKDNYEEHKSYEFCCNLQESSGQFRPMSGFIAQAKECITAITTCFEIPQLIMFAMSLSDDGDDKLFENLRRDQRPSRRADVVEYLLGHKLTDNRKQELDQLIDQMPMNNLPVYAASTSSSSPENAGVSHRKSNSTALSTLNKVARNFNAIDCLNKLEKIDFKMQRYKGPPSHRVVRLGPWLPEEETSLIEETLKEGVGNWSSIKEKLNTARSTQQLKDKWRNIKTRDIHEVAVRIGINYP